MDNTENKELIENVQNYIDSEAQSAADSVKSELSLKYGCDFEITKIGGRIDTDSTSFYIYPDFNSELIFKAVINHKTDEVSDNFIERLISEKVVAELKKELDGCGITSEAAAVFYKENGGEEDDIEITAEDYIEKYGVSSIFYYLVVDCQSLSDSSAENIISACGALSDKYGVQIVVNGVGAAEKYRECAEDLKLNPEVNSTWFDSYNPRCSYGFAVGKDGCNISASELKTILAGE